MSTVRSQVLEEAMAFFQGPIHIKTSSNDKTLHCFPSLKQAYHARVLAFRIDQQIDLYSRVILPTLHETVPKVFSTNWLGNAGRALEDMVSGQRSP